MNEEEIQHSLELLRARRQSLGELRDYKPQRGGKKGATKEPERDVLDVFAGLIKTEDEVTE